MQKNKLSVIVPIYNSELYLDKCIESILNQDYTNLEVILVNDGSKDNSLNICKKYAAFDQRIRVIDKVNEGLVEARKSGVSVSTGEFITFVDSDDWINENMYSSLFKYDFEDIDLYVTNFYITHDKYEIENEFYFKSGIYDVNLISSQIIPNMINTGEFGNMGIAPAVWVKIFKKNILEEVIKNIPSSLTIGEDSAITYPYIMKCNKILIDSTNYYHYRQLPSSMMKSYNPNTISNIKNLISYLNKKLSNYEYINKLNNYYVQLVFKCIINELNNPNGYHISKKNIYNFLNDKFIESILNNTNFSSIPYKYKVLLYTLKNKKILFLKLIYLLKKGSGNL